MPDLKHCLHEVFLCDEIKFELAVPHLAFQLELANVAP